MESWGRGGEGDAAKAKGYISWLKRTTYSAKWTTSLMGALHPAASRKHMLKSHRRHASPIKIFKLVFFLQSITKSNYVHMSGIFWSSWWGLCMSWLGFELHWINTSCGWCDEKKFLEKKKSWCASLCLWFSKPFFFFNFLSHFKHIGPILEFPAAFCSVTWSVLILMIRVRGLYWVSSWCFISMIPG